MPNSDPIQTLLFETSPFGTIDAVVESDGAVVYFYLVQHPSQPAGRFPTKACWVRNLAPGPLVINQQDLDTNRPPLLPRTHARSPAGQPAPAPDDLRVVWFEEGNAAALLENESLLAVIPPWSGMEGFHGYAADCVATSPVCWPLPAAATDPLMHRIQQAREFWESLHPETGSNPFQQLRTDWLRWAEAHCGPLDKYFAIDGGKFPPKGLGVFRTGQQITLLTVGVSLCPQPNVELHVKRPEPVRRIELAARFPSDTPQQVLDDWIAKMASTTEYPWSHWTWLGHSHTLPWLPESRAGETPAEVAWLASQSWLDETFPDRAPSEPLPHFRGDPIELLWLTPIGSNDRQPAGEPGPPASAISWWASV